MFASLQGDASDYLEAAAVALKDAAADASPILQYILLQPHC